MFHTIAAQDGNPCRHTRLGSIDAHAARVGSVGGIPQFCFLVSASRFGCFHRHRAPLCPHHPLAGGRRGMAHAGARHRGGPLSFAAWRIGGSDRLPVAGRPLAHPLVGARHGTVATYRFSFPLVDASGSHPARGDTSRRAREGRHAALVFAGYDRCCCAPHPYPGGTACQRAGLCQSARPASRAPERTIAAGRRLRAAHATWP